MNERMKRLLILKGLERLPGVLIASSECAPLSKTGGLADVVGALPKALAAHGVDARVITPYHRCIKEKYGDRVRVVQFGTSVEFCGGCHASSTGCLGMMRIVSESSVAAGVRRIEAITGKAVEDLLDRLQDSMADLRALFNNAPDLMSTVKKAINDNAELKKQVDGFKAEAALKYKENLIAKAREVNGVRVISGVLPIEAQTAKDMAFQLRGAFTEQTLVVIGGFSEGKPSLTVSLSEDLTKEGKNAGQMVREAGRLIQGGGGGQPHFAQAGGKNPDGLKAAVDKVVEMATA
jgi:alanyl-tRNA synthetase